MMYPEVTMPLFKSGFIILVIFMALFTLVNPRRAMIAFTAFWEAKSCRYATIYGLMLGSTAYISECNKIDPVSGLSVMLIVPTLIALIYFCMAIKAMKWD